MFIIYILTFVLSTLFAPLFGSTNLAKEVLENYQISLKLSCNRALIQKKLPEHLMNQSGVENFDGIELLSLQGKGAFSEVWAARERDPLGDIRIVAVKRIRRDLPPALKSAAIERLNEEAAITKTLFKSNLNPKDGIQTPLRYELDSEDPYIVFELLEGKTLREVLNQRKGPNGESFGLREALTVFLNLVSLMDQVHRPYLTISSLSTTDSMRYHYHGDIKPENIKIRPDFTPVLLDFGIKEYSHVKIESQKKTTEHGVQNSTAMGSTDQGVQSNSDLKSIQIGTPAYLPPEVVGGNTTPNPSVDVYQLGKILLEMIKEIIPILHVEADPNNQLLLIDIGKIIEKATDRNPKRYSSAGELLSDLKETLDTHSSLHSVGERSFQPLNLLGRLLKAVREKTKNSVEKAKNFAGDAFCFLLDNKVKPALAGLLLYGCYENGVFHISPSPMTPQQIQSIEKLPDDKLDFLIKSLESTSYGGCLRSMDAPIPHSCWHKVYYDVNALRLLALKEMHRLTPSQMIKIFQAFMTDHRIDKHVTPLTRDFEHVLLEYIDTRFVLSGNVDEMISFIYQVQKINTANADTLLVRYIDKATLSKPDRERLIGLFSDKVLAAKTALQYYE